MINKGISKDFGLFALLTGLFLLGGSTGAFADSIAPTSLGDMFANGCSNTQPFLDLFNYISYAGGVFLTMAGIYNLKGTIDSPQNHPLHKGLMLLAGAAGLLMLPGVISMLVATFFPQGTGAAGTGCSPAGATTAPNSGLDGMLVGLMGNIKAPLTDMISWIAIACGVFMVVQGLMKASKYGYDPKSNSAHHIITLLLFGAILIAIGDTLSIVLQSVFGSDDASQGSVVNWGPTVTNALGGASAQFTAAVTAALQFVQIIGIIAFVRGWLIMKKVVEGGGNVSLAQGITHILGGVLAINIGVFIKMMDTTFGTGLLS